MEPEIVRLQMKKKEVLNNDDIKTIYRKGTQKDLEKFKEFFDTMPEVKKDVRFKCPKCSYEEDMTIKGIQNFFV